MKNTTYIQVLLILLLCLTFQEHRGQEKPLTIDNVKTLALKNNKKIISAEHQVNAAISAKKSVNSLNKPEINVSATGLYLNEVPMNLFPEKSLHSSVNLTQIIYAGGKINTSKKMATAAIDIKQSQKTLTDSEVILNIETTYWQLINVKNKVILAKKYKVLLNGLLNDLTNLYDAGLIYKNDLLKVKVEINKAELNLTVANDNLQMLKLSLAQQAGLNNINFEVENSINFDSKFIEKIEAESALNNRPEISILQNIVEIENFQTDLLKAERKPTLGLRLSGSYMYGDNIDAVKAKDYSTNYFGIVSLNIPIFNWGVKKQRVKEQQFKSQAQQVELSETKELVILEIQNAYLELNQAIKRIDIAEKSLEQAEENLELHQDKFDAGLIKGNDVLEAQVLWQNAFSNVIDSKANYNIKKATYLKSIGQLN